MADSNRTFPEVAPPRPDCKIPLFGVRWQHPGKKPASNAWTSRAQAEATIAALEAKGATILGTSTRYCGGFAF